MKFKHNLQDYHYSGSVGGSSMSNNFSRKSNSKYSEAKMTNMKNFKNLKNIEVLDRIKTADNYIEKIKSKFDFDCFIKNNNLIIFLNTQQGDIINLPLDEFYLIESVSKFGLRIRIQNQTIDFTCNSATDDIILKIQETIKYSKCGKQKTF